MTELETALLDALVKERGRTAALEERVEALREQMAARDALRDRMAVHDVLQSVGPDVGHADVAVAGKRRQEAAALAQARTWNGA